MSVASTNSLPAPRARPRTAEIVTAGSLPSRTTMSTQGWKPVGPLGHGLHLLIKGAAMPAEAGLSVPLPLKGLLFRFDLLAQKKLLAFRRACRTPAGLGWHDPDEIRLQTASPVRRSKANAAIAPSNECNFSFKLVH